jgi:hypothetical protein
MAKRCPASTRCSGRRSISSSRLAALDVPALKRFKNGWGVGVIGGWVQQIGNDTGGVANLTNGANGNSVGLGPLVTWGGKVGKTAISAALRWVNEVEAHNRPKGIAVEPSLSATFE